MTTTIPNSQTNRTPTSQNQWALNNHTPLNTNKHFKQKNDTLNIQTHIKQIYNKQKFTTITNNNPRLHEHNPSLYYFLHKITPLAKTLEPYNT